MSYAAICTSVRRNLAFLTQSERATFEPCRSEQAVKQLAARLGVRLPITTKDAA